MRSTLLFTAKHILPAVVFLIVGAVVTFGWTRTQLQNHFTAMQMRAGENVVDVAEYVEIGGIPQWITMRGQDKTNPILLYLHGGPGATASGYGYSYQYPWEDVFTVVHWDQRGSGRSRPETGLTLDSMTMEQMLSDTVEVIDHLRARFGQEKIFIIGKSWGSLLGALLAKRRPDLLYAYIAIGQTVAWEENLEESRRLMIAYAQNESDQATVDLLMSAGPMPDPRDDWDAYINWVEIIQSPLYARGKYWHAQSNPGDIPFRMLATALMSPDMTYGEIAAFPNSDAAIYVIELMKDPEVFRFDLHGEGYDFDVPIILTMGEHDWVTPPTLAKAYFDKINAPYKKYIAFEHSAHMVGLYEETGLFFRMLIEDALPLMEEEGAYPILGQNLGKSG